MKRPTQESFLNDVADHKLTVNLDQGVFRDLKIAKPNTTDMHYNITTRPGYLFITGDMGSFVFSRLDDMFNFFRSHVGYEINLGYWEEKLQAVNARNGVKVFSADLVAELLNDHLKDHLEDLYPRHSKVNKEKAQDAKESIQDLIALADSEEHEFYEKLRNWDAEYDGGISMDDWWEWDFKDYTYHYIWCCYAIVHAIKLYDAEMSKEQSHV